MKLNRVLMLVALVVTFTVGFATQASAKTTCRPTQQGQLCLSQIDFNRFAQSTYQAQRNSQWCWAAVISMIFSYYDHPVSQEAIVQSLYGRLVNLPSGNGWNIASRVNTSWIDSNGERFRAHLTGAYDYDAGVMTVNNGTLVDELHNDRPFIIGTRGHAVVGTAVEYLQTPLGPHITGIGVFDPWPGRGARGLDPSEARAIHVGGELRFIATIRISD